MTTTVELFIESQAGDGSFVLGENPGGILGTDTLGGGSGADGIPTDITAHVYGVTTSRGRSRELDEIQAGTATVLLRNYTRDFDPYFAAGGSTPFLLEDGTPFLLEDGTPFLLENSADPQAYGAFGAIRPGKRLRVKDGAVVVFDGVVEQFDYQWTVGGEALAAIVAVDGLGKLARQSFTEWTTTAGQTPKARIVDVLDRSEVGYPLIGRDLDDGLSTLQSDLVTWGSNVLNYLQLVAKTEAGRLFVSSDGVLTFRDRHSLVTSAVQAQFDDTGTNLPFHGIEVRYGTELLFTRVGIDRENGTLQTATAEQSVLDEFGVRTYPDTTPLLFDSDEQSYQMAHYLLGRYQEPEAIISALTVKLNDLVTLDRATVAGLEVGDLVTVTWTPTGSGDTVVQTLAVEGISYRHPLYGTTDVVLSLSSANDRYGLVLDSAELGVLNLARLGF